MPNFLLFASTLILLCSFGYTMFRLGSGRLRPGRTNLAALIAAFLLILGDLWLRGQAQHSCPINSLFDVLVFTAWSIILIYLLVGSAYRLSLLGAFTTPLVLLMLLTAEFAPLDRTPRLRAMRDPWIEFHASLSLIAYGAFALAGLAGIMYLLQDRQLKSRKGGTLLYNLPPITDLAIANTRLIWLGLGLLTVAFAAGFVSGMQVNSIKFWTSASIWLAYALMVALRQIHTLAPRRTATLSIAALAFILTTLPVIQHLSAPK
ncbi:MAG: cytochrome c biogenesis protein CcsA [bacterium]